mgnify:CR=1 FL=1
MKLLVDFFKILSDETRLRILVLLFHQKLCVCELCGIMDESQPKVSKHLARLRDIGIIEAQREEQFMFYYLTIKDNLFNSIIKDIINNIDDYPVLKNDIEKSKDALKYIEMKKNSLK